MKVAIVGAGFAGLSIAWRLSSYSIDVTVFEKSGIGGGASGVSTGLLHPFVGSRAIRSWKADEGMQETLHLIDVAEKAIGRPVAERSGIFRPALTAQQKTDFFARSQEEPELLWQEHPIFGEGLWIPSGLTIYSKLYLQGLWMDCQAKGVRLTQEKVSALEDLSSFDAIVIAGGFESFFFAPHLPLRVTKGQTLLCRWQEKLPYSVVSVGHITPTEDPSICQVGSTYEHGFKSLAPDASALRLLEKVASFYPPARDFQVLEIRAGVRISRMGSYHPLIEKITPNTWVFTALGSRGLLYHALLGKQLVQEMIP